jgi:LmbE family N-acetylglucosaminyl deacetylase
MTTLVLAAHPDDEVLGCGGLIRKLALAGEKVVIGVLSGGGTSRFSAPGPDEQAQRRQLTKDCRKAAALLGASELALEDLPDNRFDSLDLLAVVKIVESMICRFKPAALYTHHGSDLNLDHSVTFRAALTACRPMAGSPVKTLRCFEVASSTEWAFGRVGPCFAPDYFVDISGTLEDKLAAMALYESEFRPFPHPRSAEALAAKARNWGSTMGLAAAEAFETVFALA